MATTTAFKVRCLLAAYNTGQKFFVKVMPLLEMIDITFFYQDEERAMKHCLLVWNGGDPPAGVSIQEWYMLVGNRKMDGKKNLDRCCVVPVAAAIVELLVMAGIESETNQVNIPNMGLSDTEADMLSDILLNSRAVKSVSPNKGQSITHLDDVLRHRFSAPLEEYEPVEFVGMAEVMAHLEKIATSPPMEIEFYYTESTPVEKYCMAWGLTEYHLPGVLNSVTISDRALSLFAYLKEWK